ncbi:MAG: Peptidyl-prolyl cis-trans isomerase cyp6 [Vezdaea acicularis]|nr:MAG: Peptidyl-prolyl cis-trans isomerase cyp6 [Vezdaea acicularis]
MTEIAQQPPEAVTEDDAAPPDQGPDEGSNDETEEAKEKLRREAEARAQALTLEIVGDLPYAEVKPPENILFVCKLNPVTEGQKSVFECISIDEDLRTIFSRFGEILSCEIIRDKRTGDSLQYAFIEFENQKDCEQAYFKMHGVLIDDHRIHVDFSQSVSKLSDTWRTATNSKRAKQGGGFGGISGLEKKRQYKAVDESAEGTLRGYGMVIDKEAPKKRDEEEEHYKPSSRRRSRSRSPRRDQRQYDDRRNHRSDADRKYHDQRRDNYRDRDRDRDYDRRRRY